MAKKKKPNTSLQSSLNKVDLDRGYPTKSRKKGSKKKVHPSIPPANASTLGLFGGKKKMPLEVNPNKKKGSDKKKTVSRGKASRDDSSSVQHRLAIERELGMHRNQSQAKMKKKLKKK